MRINYGWLLVTAIALLPGCGDDSEKVVRKDGAADGAKDGPVADVVLDMAETQASPDKAPDLPPPDVAPDLPAVETGQPDRTLSSEAGGETSGEAGLADLRAGLEVQGEAGKPDAALSEVAPEVAGEAGPPPSYTCRNDADCCIAIDGCMARAYLYSKAPGASPIPPFSGLNDMCLACIPPAVQVHCESGQCVGEKLPQVYSGPLVQSHCGPVALPDAGAVLYYQAAFAGAQQTSWGCGG